MKSSKIPIERVRKVISELNPIDDLIFRKLSESKEFCEEILREFMQDSELEVIENHSQYSITNIDRKSIILDAYCLLKDGKRVDIRIDIDIKIVLLKKLYNILIWKLNSHVTDGINNNFIKKGIKSYLIRDIIFYIQLCYNKHTKLKEVAL